MTEYIDPADVDEFVVGSGFQYRDRSLLLSALASPMPVFGEEVYLGLHLKAAVLIASVNQNHPLVDGNKRLSWLLAGVFYELNGWDLVPDDTAEAFVLSIAAGSLSRSEIEDWLEDHAMPFPS